MNIGINAQNLTKLLPIYNKSTSRKELLSELTNIYVLKGCEICCAVVSFQRKIDRLSTSECLLKARLSTMCIIHWLESSRQVSWEFDFLASGTALGTWTPEKGNSGGILPESRNCHQTIWEWADCRSRTRKLKSGTGSAALLVVTVIATVATI